ncbi:MAG: LysR substrate-binding domain-containing protein [Pseudomonadota bacterium]
MRRQLPQLNLLLAFERAAYHRSFKLAAAELHITPSAVSHRIRQLESDLGIPLFQRLPRSIRLTAAGQTYFRDIHRAFARIENGTEQLSHQFGRQVLRLHLLPFFATEVLVPRLQSFQSQHPDIDLRLESSFGRSQTHPDHADLSIGLGQGSWPGLVSLPLMELELQAMCTPALAARIRPDHAEDINEHTLIYFESNLDAWEQWARGVGLKKFEPASTLTMDSIFSALQAAEQGLGIVTAALPLTANWLERSHLVPAFPERVKIPDRYYALYRKGDEVRPNVQQFLTWLSGEFG